MRDFPAGLLSGEPLSRLSHATRRELFDFLVAQLRLREPLCPQRIGPVVRALPDQGDDLLAFALQLDRDLAVLAAEFQVPVETARTVLNVELLPRDDASRWPRQAMLRSQLGSRHVSLRVAAAEVVRIPFVNASASEARGRPNRRRRRAHVNRNAIVVRARQRSTRWHASRQQSAFRPDSSPSEWPSRADC